MGTSSRKHFNGGSIRNIDNSTNWVYGDEVAPYVAPEIIYDFRHLIYIECLGRKKLFLIDLIILNLY